MISKKENNKISKFLSLVLRHNPETIGVNLDENGWVNTNELIDKSNSYGIKFDFETLAHIVETNSKKRFAFNPDSTKIRASQGHSLNVELGYEKKKPPEFLFHGTAEKSVNSIFKNGLERRNRQHVHLSIDLETATKVGQRHGKPFIFKVSAEQMEKDEYEFFISDNGVWLTEHVPTKYLSRNE